MKAREQLTDQLLVLHCQEGNPMALEQLMARWQDRLWRHANRLCNDDQAAWDALHTTFHAPANHRIHWFDDQGRELKSETEAAGSHLRHTVVLGAPVLPGERIRLRRVQHQDQAATREENIWTFRTDTSYGGAHNHFALTVQLPDGAAILETTPNPTTDGSSPESGAPLLRFEDVRKANEPFVCSVRYRLPDHTTP